ncbi:MAG TPA: tetratricopeptide repeat protein [Longimicrobiales bacterium]|nr:tetratricopeptide repeat protein [Longimicrobiales bacterium]
MSAQAALRRVGAIALAVTGLTAVAVAAPSAASAQGELFEQGNQLYQQEDFAGAIDAYQAVLSAGWEGAALHYNLGNAYFKTGELGRAILEWERALVLEPGDPDALANLELARSLTADAVEPLPRFWLFALVDWWVTLIPRALLRGLVAGAWLALAAGIGLRVLTRGEGAARWGGRVAVASGVLVLVLGTNLLVRELGIGRAERAVVLADAVPVRSAPADQDDLTLFEIHEGTRVRIDQRAGEWAEIVLDDGKVGWVPVGVFEEI